MAVPAVPVVRARQTAAPAAGTAGPPPAAYGGRRHLLHRARSPLAAALVVLSALSLLCGLASIGAQVPSAFFPPAPLRPRSLAVPQEELVVQVSEEVGAQRRQLLLSLAPPLAAASSAPEAAVADVLADTTATKFVIEKPPKKNMTKLYSLVLPCPAGARWGAFGDTENKTSVIAFFKALRWNGKKLVKKGLPDSLVKAGPFPANYTAIVRNIPFPENCSMLSDTGGDLREGSDLRDFVDLEWTSSELIVGKTVKTRSWSRALKGPSEGKDIYLQFQVPDVLSDDLYPLWVQLRDSFRVGPALRED